MSLQAERLAANYLAQDRPDIQFATKEVHVETNETLLVEIKEDRPISLGTSQSNHAIQ